MSNGQFIWFAWYPVRDQRSGRLVWLNYVIAEKVSRFIPQGIYRDCFNKTRSGGIAYQWKWLYWSGEDRR